MRTHNKDNECKGAVRDGKMRRIVTIVGADELRHHRRYINKMRGNSWIFLMHLYTHSPGRQQPRNAAEWLQNVC
jgi:hypothetical protein